MLYKKPKNITYTQMAIAVDEMAYSDNCNDELLFEYLYHLSYMLAVKGRYFNSSKLYEDFAVYVASSVFFRLKNKKQFELNENGAYKLNRIKSILNYLKGTLYFRKVNFEQENYSQILSYEEQVENSMAPQYTFSNMLSSMAEGLIKVEFECDLENIVNSFKFYLKKIPYKYKSNEWYNIYMSCLLTFLDSITLSYKDLDKIYNMKYKVDDINIISEYFTKNNVILYQLDDSMKDYILILVRTIKHIIAKELSEYLNCEVNCYNLNDVIIFNEINGNNSYYEE